jgi:D-alanyl-D-alanine carboxypeptidase (penicillin-binding protein 5/6)
VGATVRRALWLYVALHELASAATAATPSDRFPTAAQAYAVAIDGEIRWARALDSPLPPASLTKVLTALVLLEDDWQPDTVVTVSERAAHTQGTRLNLHPGDRMTAADALTAALVHSANDACLALAEQSAGSVEKFVARMNEEARAMGLSHTFFKNPCGLDEPGHVSTALDLVELAKLAMRNDEIARRVRLTDVEVRTLTGRVFRFHNNNALIGRLPGAKGVKSGFTTQAGKCVMAWVERDGRQVTLVLLNAPDRWWTAAGIVEQAFAAQAARLGTGDVGSEGTKVLERSGASYPQSPASSPIAP